MIERDRGLNKKYILIDAFFRALLLYPSSTHGRVARLQFSRDGGRRSRRWKEVSFMQVERKRRDRERLRRESVGEEEGSRRESLEEEKGET